MYGNPETVSLPDQIAALESRVSKLEQMLLNFAGMVVGTPGELERVSATIEARHAKEVAQELYKVDPERRSKAMPKIGRLLIGNGPVAHSVIVKALQGILSGKQVSGLMADLAAQGEIKVVKSVPDAGKPTTFYEYIRGKRP